MAARARGLGTCFTAAHLKYEQQAAAILGLPKNIGQAGLVALAHTVGDRFYPAARQPLAEVLHRDHW